MYEYPDLLIILADDLWVGDAGLAITRIRGWLLVYYHAMNGS